MPVSSTLITSAPASAKSSEQKPPGRSRDRSRTVTPSSVPGAIIALPPAECDLAGRCVPSDDSQRSSGSPGTQRLGFLSQAEHLARLGDGCRTAADVLGHLARLRD